VSRYSGPQGRGAARVHRAAARAAAEERNAAAAPERRAEFGRQRARIRAALSEREVAMLQDALAPAAGGAP
jgi:hypothetical protein